MARQRTELPAVVRDEAINRFITGKLLQAKEEGNSLEVSIGNTLIDRTVADLRAYFPEAYAGGDSGGNVAALPERESFAS
jgi:hypothetical protein